MQNRQQPPIVALATPWGKSALAVVRISGRDCIEQFAPIFSQAQKLKGAAANSLVVGTIIDPHNKEPLDQVVVAIYRAPHSYTGEDSLEISCHGSPVGIRRILALCQQHGFRTAEAGEFTHRALLAGKMDLTQAEAVQEIIEARSIRSHSQAFHRLAGVIKKSILREVERITMLIAAINIQLDYPVEESGDIHFDNEALTTTIESLSAMEQSYHYGSLAQEGLTLVISGRVNAGKSSLFNLLLGEERALIASTPGTTRDYLEGTIEIAGIPIRLYDTAGMRQESDMVERRGIERGLELAQAAHIRLHLIDITEQHNDQPILLKEDHTQLVITIYNKIDKASPEQLQRIPAHGWAISATHGSGTEQLLAHLASLIHSKWGAESTANEGAIHSSYSEAPIISERQRGLIQEAARALRHAQQAHHQGISADLLVLDLQDALQALGKITGEVGAEQILETMFSNFCVGK